MPCDYSVSFNGSINEPKSFNSSNSSLWRSKSFAEGINPVNFNLINCLKQSPFMDKKAPSLTSLNLSNTLNSSIKNYSSYSKSPYEMRLESINNFPSPNAPIKGLYKNTYLSDSQLKKHLSLDASSISSICSSGSESISRSK